MNHIAEVAKLLGVEIGEEFEVVGVGYNPHHFLETELVDCDCDPCADTLAQVLCGTLKIKRKPWKPEQGEQYYNACPTDPDLWDEYTWDGNNIDNFLFDNRLIFRTKEAAIEASNKMLKALEASE